MSKSDAEKVYYLRGLLKSQATIIAVGGGKGGVGKSFVSSGLGLFLAHLGYETLLIDLDLGSANLHTSLGENPGDFSISDYLSGKVSTINELAKTTKIPHLKLISGSNDSLDMADISEAQKSKLMSGIFHTNADYIILDLSAGTHKSTLDFFLMANHQILAITPEPSSIENAYRFIKSAFFRKIKRYEFQLNLGNLIGKLMANKEQNGIRTPADLLYYVSKEDPENGVRLRDLMESMKINLIINQVRSPNDVALGPSIESVCKKYFGIDTNLLGHLDYDNAVWQSLRKKKHLLLEYPHSKIYAQLLGITRKISKKRVFKSAG